MIASDEYMPTDIQFKYELRKQLTDLQRKLELLENKEYEKINKFTTICNNEEGRLISPPLSLTV